MLGAPVVQGPITPFSSMVKVNNTLTGATVHVFESGALVGKGMAEGPVTFVKLNPGVTLTPGRLITSSQDLNGDTSPTTPDTAAVTVLKTPTVAMLGEIISRTRPLQCGICLWLEGIVPGATVTVAVPGEPQITITAEWTPIHIDVPALASGSAVQVRQTACGVIGPLVTLPPALRQATGPVERIDSPSLDTPLYLCQRAITIHPLPGAKVTLEHNDHPSEFCFGSTTGTFWLSSPLQIQDRIRTRQEFLRCESRSGEAEYSPSEPIPPPPGFPSPVCAGDVQVEVTGLIPGALVQFFTDRTPEPICIASAAVPPYRFNLPPLEGATRLGVRQTLCDFSPWSDTTYIDLLPIGPPDEPGFVIPILACGVAVAVSGLREGTRVRVVSDLWGGPIGEAMGNGDEFVDVPLWFPLVAGDRLHLETIACGVFRSLEQLAFVLPRPDTLFPPDVDDPLDDCGGCITVRQLAPGALLDVERVSGPNAPDDDGTLLTSVAVTRVESSVAVPPLAPSWFIRVRQRLCERTSRPSRIVTVGDRTLRYETNSTARLCQLTGSGPLNPPRTFFTDEVDILGTDLGIPAGSFTSSSGIAEKTKIAKPTATRLAGPPHPPRSQTA